MLRALRGLVVVLVVVVEVQEKNEDSLKHATTRKHNDNLTSSKPRKPSRFDNTTHSVQLPTNTYGNYPDIEWGFFLSKYFINAYRCRALQLKMKTFNVGSPIHAYSLEYKFT